MKMQKAVLDGGTVFFGTAGSGTPVVIETAMGSTCAEWWHLAESLSSGYRVLVYDRPGYGESPESDKPRTPENAAALLEKLMEHAGIGEPAVMIGHSLGGLYVQEFAMRFPEKVRGLVLIDPLTVQDPEFRNVLTAEEFRQSPVDKTPGIRLGKLFCSLGLGFLIRALSSGAIPFYYKNDFSPEAKRHIMKAKGRKKSYTAALEEYLEAEKTGNTRLLREFIFSGKRSDIPVFLALHDPEVMIEETMAFGGSTRETAEKIETAWSGFMKNAVIPYVKSRTVTLSGSGHYLQLQCPEIIREALGFILSSAA